MVLNLKNKNNFILLETLKFDNSNNKSLFFENPEEILFTYNFIDIKSIFNKIQKLIENNYYIAGFISYESGLFFNQLKNFKIPSNINFPLLYFGVYNNPINYNKRFIINNKSEEGFRIENLVLDTNYREFKNNIVKIKNYIKAGDIYQVNYTIRYNFEFYGSVIDFYNHLKNTQKVSYAALIKFDNNWIISLSPELFFKIQNNNIIVKPMKGTIERGFNINEDNSKICYLKNSKKELAENLMIVDLLRNDLGKISEYGEVKVDKLFEIEKYETLFQMTSTISSKLRNNVTYYNIFEALFPSGSVTGAPKIRSMQIIQELEKSTRNIYTGSIGFISPHNEAIFNVGIRTILISGNKGVMGVGSGITWDSDVEKEYNENILKAKFFTDFNYNDFKLIETFLYKNGIIYYLFEHLKRLKESSEYFDFKFDYKRIIESLINYIKRLNYKNKYKIRLLLSRDGEINLQSELLKEIKRNGKIKISSIKINKNNKFLYHKTTIRDIYNQEYEKAIKNGYIDYIFTNENNEITEGCIHNIIIKKDNSYFTPQRESGLLNGIYRQLLLERKIIKEKILYIDDLKNSDKIYLCNSVTGLKKVIFD